jgi:hypothetical protein
MEKVEVFKCSTCGKIFTTEEEAIKCEQTHIVNGKIVKADYEDGHKNNYPSVVYVHFDGDEEGKVVKYEFPKRMKKFYGKRH